MVSRLRCPRPDPPTSLNLLTQVFSSDTYGNRRVCYRLQRWEQKRDGLDIRITHCFPPRFCF